MSHAHLSPLLSPRTSVVRIGPWTGPTYERREAIGRFRAGVGVLVMNVLWLGALGVRSIAAQDTDIATAEPQLPALFASHDELTITLTSNFTALRLDRAASPERPALVTLETEDGGSVDVGAQLRTRGEFRLDASECSFPPLRLDVRRSEAGGTVLEGQDKLKIVASCRPGREAYRQYVLTEYLAYRSYGMLTDESFRVRLVRLKLVDTAGSAEPEERLGFLVEEDEVLSARMGGTLFELEDGKNLPATAFDPLAATTAAIFQYMIGNTDWSGVAEHNVSIIERAGAAVAVPFDFDFAGVVDATYATPDPDYQLASVRDRYYRGWCTNPVNVAQVLDLFRDARDPILELWAGMPGLTDETVRRTTRYLQEFFDDIESDERAQRRFLRDCRTLPG